VIVTYEENLTASLTEGSSVDLGQAEMDEIRDQRAEERQAQLDEAVAKLRAKNEADLAANEAANYARTHAIIERDENGNPEE
jgi:hypothetical protein